MARKGTVETTFVEGDTRPAGHIFYVPVSDRPGDDHDDRKHFLLTDCGSGRLATLAAMTTKPGEVNFGANVYEIKNPNAVLKAGQVGSFVAPYQLIFRNGHLLDRSVDAEPSHLPGVLDAVRDALGIGTGLPRPGYHPKSLRGRLVRLTDEAKDIVFFRYAFILTRHEYSSARRWQLLLPVLHAPSLPVDAWTLEPVDISSWRGGLPKDWGRVLLMTERIVSLSQGEPRAKGREADLPNEIEFVLSERIDEGSLAQVEAALVTRLGLPAPAVAPPALAPSQL